MSSWASVRPAAFLPGLLWGFSRLMCVPYLHVPGTWRTLSKCWFLSAADCESWPQILPILVIVSLRDDLAAAPAENRLDCPPLLTPGRPGTCSDPRERAEGTVCDVQGESSSTFAHLGPPHTAAGLAHQKGRGRSEGK